jgi:hypothetical protein
MEGKEMPSDSAALNQPIRDFLLRCKREDYQFPGEVSRQYKGIETDLKAQAAVSRQLGAEVEALRLKREQDVLRLCGEDFHFQTKALREIRELAIRSRFTIEMVHNRLDWNRRNRGFDHLPTFQQQEAIEELKKQENDIKSAIDSAIRRMHQELDKAVEEREEEQEREKERLIHEKINALEKQIADRDQTDELASDEAIFRREGESWVIVYEGKKIRMKDRKGLHHIAILLEHPDKDLSPFEVEKNTNSIPREAPDKMIDPKAQNEIRQQIEDLQVRLDEDDFPDPEQRLDVRDELEKLKIYSRQNQRLGGGARDMNSAFEKARKRVSKAIRSSLANIKKEHRTLGLHLERAIHTGRILKYTPSSPIHWDL